MAGYVELIFDYKRHGLNHIAVSIIDQLDYFSLVQLKRTCHLLYGFIRSSNLEEKKLSQKLLSDWAHNSPKVLKPSGQCKDILEKLTENKTNYLSFFENSSYIYISSGNAVLSVSRASLGSAQQKEDTVQVYTNTNENLETNVITTFDFLMDEYLITGSKNGMLSIFNIRNGELKSFKQLFGIISQIRCQSNLIASAHMGKQLDIGCISIRKFLSPNEIQVVWSVYEDVMPVFAMDFNIKYTVGLEWVETHNGKHGVATVYKRCGEDSYSWSAYIPSIALSQLFTTLTLFKEDFLALGSGGVEAGGVLWDFNLVILDLKTSRVIQTFKAHTSPIFSILSCGDLLLTRDKAGSVYLWNAGFASDSSYRLTEDYSVLLRKLTEEEEEVRSMCVDQRRVVFISQEKPRKTNVKLLDFWSQPLNN